MHIFFENLFDTLTNSPKNICAPLHTICDSKHTQNWGGGNKQKKILDQVLTQPWTKFWLKKPQILDQVLTLQHIYICCGVKILAKFYPFQSQSFGQVSFFKNNWCKKHCKNRGFSTILKIKKKRAPKFQCQYFGQVGLFFGTPNLAKILTLTWPKYWLWKWPFFYFFAY